MKTDIPHIVDLMAEDPEILLVYVFGSAATDTSHALSDIDIAVLLPQGEPAYFFRKESELFLRLVERGVGNADIVILNLAGVELQYKVITTGKLLFARSDADRIQFEESVLLNYFYHKPFFELYDNAVLQRIKKSP